MEMDKLIQGIAAAITAANAGDFSIYDEENVQNLSPPCFLITDMEENQSRLNSIRSHSKNYFDIQFFPKEDSLTPRSDCRRAANNLYDCLKTIELEDGYINGAGMRSEIIDNVLHFFVGYHYDYYTQNTEERMQDLTINMELEGGT